MGKIIISQNITLDGVVQDPTGEGLEHRRSEDTVELPDLSDVAGPGDQEPNP